MKACSMSGLSKDYLQILFCITLTIIRINAATIIRRVQPKIPITSNKTVPIQPPRSKKLSDNNQPEDRSIQFQNLCNPQAKAQLSTPPRARPEPATTHQRINSSLSYHQNRCATKIIRAIKATNNRPLILKDLREIETLQTLLAPPKESQLSSIQEVLIRKGQAVEGMGPPQERPETEPRTAWDNLAPII